MRSITVKLLCFVLALSALVKVQGQVTTSSMSGTVKDGKGQGLVGATIALTHTPTGTVYTSVSRNGGIFDLPNIRAGGPYRLEVSFVGFDKLTRNDIFVNLGETSTQDINMEEKSTQLTEVVVAATRTNKEGAKGGAGTDIGRDKMANLPTVGRNVADYLRYVPQTKTTVDGGISIAGQNNRYNSFYIDGAANNDVFGLSASGTNGGQAGIAPISIDAIDQFQVVISPYDASLGNFTGGGINAITRSGTNNYEGSVYYFWRNEGLSGKTPGVAKEQRVRLADFSNQTTGFRVSGPIIENKLFFFLNGEIQRDTRPQPFNFSTYNGKSSQADLDNLANFLRSNYGYDPGGYLDNAEKVEADRIVFKIDWNVNDVHKLSASYRYNKGLRYNTSRSSNNTINFYNNGYLFPTSTHSGSLELNSRFKRNSNNRLLLTFTNVEDDRGPIGDAFPRVRINDGAGSIVFGTEEFSTGNLLQQNNYALFDVYKFYLGKHTLSVGTDDEISSSTNIFIRQNFGSYVFDSLDAFMTGATAATYDRTYSLVDPPKTTGDNSVNAAAKFTTLRLGFFINDEIKLSDRFSLNLGLRLDNTNFITTPKEDKFFNDSAIAALSQHYDLKGARSGQISDPKWSLNPRLGFVFKVPEEKITLRGGVGFFTGRVPLVWPGGVYNNNGISLAGIRSSNVAFREDPFNQYEASDFGINVPVPSGQIDLVAKDFKMNKVFRTSLAVDKEFGQGWRFSLEGIYTKNINEIDYKNINLLPPTKKSVGPDSRNVYDLAPSSSFPVNIPIRSNGSNPYTGVFLLSNNEGRKGYSYSVTATIDKRWSRGWAFNANYTYGNSVVLNEGTSSQNNSQWRFMETVNGRNFMQLSTSDYDIGHRISAYAAKKFTYGRGVFATTVSLVYNGQSGSPFSYVLNRGMVRDVDNNETNDLLYIPTAAELQNMIFLTNTITSTNTTYTPQQQKDLFEAFIQNDKYLRKHRGEYAERNEARLPFSNIIDLKIQQDFNLKFGSKTVQVQITYDIFNFTNFLNNDWGKTYFITNDQSPILEMASFVSASDLTPRYRFTPPASGKPYVLSDGVFNSARWSSQLGVRLSVF